jgi:hypothetical protein
MSKKSNTIIFLAAASAFNILITIVLFFAACFAAISIYPALINSEPLLLAVYFGCFVLAFAGSILIYRAVLGLIRRKVDLEKYFDPIFGKSGDKLR